MLKTSGLGSHARNNRAPRRRRDLSGEPVAIWVRSTALASTLLLLLASFSAVAVRNAAPAAADDYTVSQDAARTGWDSSESALAPSQVTASDFGQQFSTAVTGAVYAQPVVVGNTAIVATEDDNAYGIDVRTGSILWSRNFGAPFASSTVSCADISPNLGVTSTPVYDPSTGTVYMTSKVADGPTPQQPHWYLQALNVADGSERPGYPMVLQGTADNDPTVTFNPMVEQQRPGLLLANGRVYIAFGSHCDYPGWRGWVMAVDVSGAPSMVSSWVSEVSTGSGGGIWQSGGGLVTDGNDSNGNPRIFLATGNGISPVPGPGSSPPGQLAESVLRLGVDANGHISAKDFFAPGNADTLDQNDTDLGSGGPAALPDSFGTPSHPHLLVEDGKDGRLFLLDRDNLGGRDQGPGGSDSTVQTVGPFNGIWGHPAVYPGQGGYVYYVENGGPLRAYSRSVDGNGNPALSPAGASTEVYGYTSGSPIVTSAGTTAGSALVWVVYTSGGNGTNAQLRAYDAVPASGKMVLRWSAPIGTVTKFATPATSGGRIFVGTRDGHLVAFGRPAAIALTAQPVDFGTAPVNSSVSAVAHFTASSAVTVTGATTKAPFTASPTGLPATLAAGDTYDVPVGFTPTQAGAASATLNLTTSLGPVAVDLHGVGTQTGLAFSPSPVAFGTVVTGYTKTLAVTIGNTGTTDETVSSVDSPPGPFTVSGVPPAGTVIPAQGTLALSMTYAPVSGGSDSSSLTVHSTSGAYTVAVTGTAVVGQGHLTLTPASTDFGSVVVGASRTLTFAISNSGNIPITLTLAKAPSGIFSTTEPAAEGITIGPDDVIQQQVTFTPNTTGPATDVYRFNANDGQGEVDETLTGTGVGGSALAAPTSAAWSKNGSASLTSTGDLQLTPVAQSQTGSAFPNATIPSTGMDASFQIQIGGGSGADGLTFTMMDASLPATSLGAPGGGLGYGGLAPATAVTFDTFQNGDDPSANFVGVATGSPGTDLSYFNYAATSTNVPQLTSGTHNVDVNYYAGQLTVSVDGDVKMVVQVSLPAQIRPGFTAATGGQTDQHLVRNVRIVSTSAPSDTTPPTVSLTSPAPGATVWGTVPVTVNAADDYSGVAQVTYRLDNQTLGSSATAPFTLNWATGSIPDGVHNLSAVAVDAAGNTSLAASESVTVLNDPPVDVSTSVHAANTATTASFSTHSSNDLVLAFVSAGSGSTQKTAVTGAGLTWTLVRRANAVSGATEVWSARATGLLQNVTVRAKANRSGTDVALTVVALSGGRGVGNSAASSSTKGAPACGLTTLSAGSWIFGVLNDPASAAVPSPTAGQTLVDQWSDPTAHAAMWVQRSSPQAPAGSVVSIADTAPTADPVNAAVVEITR